MRFPLVAFFLLAHVAVAQTPAHDRPRPEGAPGLSAGAAGLDTALGADGSSAARGEGYDAISYDPSGPPLVGTVLAMVLAPDGTLYAGGNFTGPNGIRNVASRRDGEWEPLGAGLGGSSFDDTVYALAVGPDGSVYAGGRFTADGGTLNHMARWDGTAWNPLGSGFNYEVAALAVGPDGSIYAGGTFTTADGVPANRVARWDGAAWSALGDGVNEDGVGGRVRALAVGPDGSVYVGGYFATAGGAAANRVARWDGTAWSPLGSGVGSISGDVVEALAVDLDGSVYAGGRFTVAGGAAANRIARWDGAAWHRLGVGIDATVYALAFDAGGVLYAGGSFATAGGTPANRMARWDGATWSPLGSGVGVDADYVDYVATLAVGADGSVYAGGRLTTAGEALAKGAAQWDGTAWRALGAHGFGDYDGYYGDVFALARGPDGSVYAGGSFTAAGEVLANRVARWDGDAWNALGSGVGVDDNYVAALAVGPDGSVYAGGNFTTAGGTTTNRLARWDGTAWSQLGSSVSGIAVYALAVDPSGILHAGGYFSAAGGMPADGVARWDGSAWISLGGGFESVTALAIAPDGSVYAGGRFTAGGYGVSRWDGAAWSPLGSGINSSVRALAVGPDGSVYAGGFFVTAGGSAANRVARWDGSMWSALGDGVGTSDNDYVFALTVGLDGSVYVGGDFTTAGGVPANRVARWDGAAWSALGDGADRSVYALVLDGDEDLILGGAFRYAGGVPSPRVARYDLPFSTSTAPNPTAGAALSVGPNPTSGRATAWVTLPPAAEGATLSLYDMLGRRVAGMLVSSGPVDLPTARLAPGVYVVRLVAGGETKTARLVVTR